MEVMDEWQIAFARARLLHKLRYWGYYSTTVEGSFDEEEVESGRLERMAKDLAMSRAKASKRDFKTVMREIELRIALNLATLLELEPAIHPVVLGTRDFKVEEDRDGAVCGVCQEEMEKGQSARAMDCMHAFHESCIWKWLEIKSSCPLCRNPLRTEES